MNALMDLLEQAEAKKRTKQARKQRMLKIIIPVASVLLIGSIVTGLYGCPKYRVWQQGLEGEAELKRAESNRKVKVYEAEARFESAKLDAKSEVERAKGVAEANKIVADGLRGHEEYLKYLWIDKVAGNSGREIVYVPTEANMPILEAGRRSEK